jgi:MFS family permease
MGRLTREQRLFIVLVAASVLFFTAQGMLFPVLPRYVKRELGGDGFAVGIAVSSFAIGAMLARPWGGLLADRIGRRAVATFGSLLWAAMVVCYPIGGAHAGTAGVIAARTVGGVGGGVLFVAMAAIASDLWPEDRRVQGFSLFSLSTLFGFAVGPSVGELVLDGDRWGRTFVLCGVLALAPAAVMAVLPDTRRTAAGDAGARRGAGAAGAPGAPPPRPVLFHRAARGPGVGLLLGSLGFITFAAFVPLHADELGMRNVWVVLLVNPATTLLVRLATSRLADRVPRRALTAWSLAFVVLSAVVLALWATPTGVYVAAVCNGIGSAYVFPGFLAMTVDRTDERDRAQAIGSLTVFSDLASSAGGALLGVAADAWSYRGAFALAAGCAACSLLVLWLGPPERPTAARVRAGSAGSAGGTVRAPSS